MTIQFEPDEWLYCKGPKTAMRVREFFGLCDDALVEFLKHEDGVDHWRASTDRVSDPIDGTIHSVETTVLPGART